MSRILKLLGLLLVVAVAGCAGTPQGTMIVQEPSSQNRFIRLLSGSPAMPGRPAPDAALFDLKGKSVQLKQVLDAVPDKQTGKQPSILLFSKTTCPYSTQEHVEVQTAMETLKKNAKVVTILVDETPQSAREYTRSNHVPGTVLVDPEAQAAHAYKIEMVPTLLMVNTSGYVNEFRHFTPARDVVSLMMRVRQADVASGGCAPSG